MSHYPPVITKICKHCKANVTLERQGSGRPHEGGLDYWYTTDHCCPESDKAVEAMKSERLTLEGIMSDNLF
jgi:hypothetical protein